MSAIFVQYDSTGIDIDEFTDSFHVLNDRGPDGRDCFIDHQIAIGCQHFAAISPSQTLTQPVIDNHHAFSFDGRVDNRQALVRNYVGIESDMDDMEIFISLFKKHDVDAFNTIVGPFFAVVYNVDTQRLLCGRDTMGLRHVFYATGPEALRVASSPDAILANPHSQYPPDNTAIAGYLSQHSIYAEPSFYDGIKTLGRGSYLVCTTDSLDERRYHTFTSQ
jgi:asparagine synthase (glutamine-hydrolysing)